MNPPPSEWRSILLSLAAAALVTAAGPFMVAVWAYVMGPPRSDPDPSIFVVLAAMMLGPSAMLGLAIKRARRVSLHSELGGVGRGILIALLSLTAATLGLGGLYAIARLMKWPV